MIKRGSIATAAAAVVIALGAHIASASNVGKLYGTWTPVRFSPNPNLPGRMLDLCNAKMIFTPTTQSVWMGNHPDWTVTPLRVTYLDRPNTVVGVLGNTGRPTIYRFIDNSHIVDTADVVQCIYQRR